MVQSNERAMALHEEREKLADVIRLITERLRQEGLIPTVAPYQKTMDALEKFKDGRDNELVAALLQPYFGRMDFRIEGEQSSEQTVYIGEMQIRGTNVISWTAPVAKLYYSNVGKGSYKAPEKHPIREIHANIYLRRYLRVRDGEIEDLRDTFRRALPVPDSGREDVLKQALSGVGTQDGQFQVIVDTIEPDQYEKVANVDDKVLIVQGAAGSGKSEIGLHRIAYLLSPHNGIDITLKPTPDTTLYIGPSQAFLEYTADILPSLRVAERVHQAKLSDWRDKQMSKRVSFNFKILDNLLDRGEITRFNEEVETFKGSLALADTLERHIEEKATAIRKAVLKLPNFSPFYAREELSSERIQSTVNTILGRRPSGRNLNGQRLTFINRIARLICSRGNYAKPLSREDVSHVENTVVKPWCGNAWPEIDFKEEYVRLLSDPQRMTRLTRPAISQGVAEELARSAGQMRKRPFLDADLAAMAYLDHLLNGTIRRMYRHIVIDEAQDMSPIEFKLLAASSTNNWFTVLGDTAQRLTPYKGIRTWRDLERVFGRSDIEFQRARRSYRSTKQITRFNNKILKTFAPNIPPPIAFERDGNRVEYKQHKKVADMYAAILDDVGRIRGLNGLKDAVIAILARDRRNLNQFQKFCRKSGVTNIETIDSDKHSVARTVLAMIHDVRGLEYDAVIVMGVNDSFTNTEFNKRLLYVATTRAKHYLSLHWSGKRSPILRSISDRGIIQHLHGSRNQGRKKGMKTKRGT